MASATAPLQKSVVRKKEAAAPPMIPAARPGMLKPPVYQYLAPGRSSKRSRPSYRLRGSVAKIGGSQR
jgi:hypothetical protein